MKPIAQVIYRKSKTVKNYLFVFPDKSIVIRNLLLVDEKDNDTLEFGDSMYIRFGKKLIQRKDFHISAETISVMNHLANEYKFDVPEGTIQYGKITKIKQ